MDNLSPTRIENNLHKGKFHSTNGTSNFFSNEQQEKQMMREKSHEALNFNPKGVPLKQKTLKRAELAAKLDKNVSSNAQQNKLPPSIRWVTTDEDPDQDFFEDFDTRYQRNPKAIAQLAPLMGNKNSGKF